MLLALIRETVLEMGNKTKPTTEVTNYSDTSETVVLPASQTHHPGCPGAQCLPTHLVSILVTWIARTTGVEANIRGGEAKIAILWFDSETLWGAVVRSTRMVAHRQAAVVRPWRYALHSLTHYTLATLLSGIPWANSLALAAL